MVAKDIIALLDEAEELRHLIGQQICFEDMATYNFRLIQWLHCHVEDRFLPTYERFVSGDRAFLSEDTQNRWHAFYQWLKNSEAETRARAVAYAAALQSELADNAEEISAQAKLWSCVDGDGLSQETKTEIQNRLDLAVDSFPQKLQDSLVRITYKDTEDMFGDRIAVVSLVLRDDVPLQVEFVSDPDVRIAVGKALRDEFGGSIAFRLQRASDPGLAEE